MHQSEELFARVDLVVESYLPTYDGSILDIVANADRFPEHLVTELRTLYRKASNAALRTYVSGCEYGGKEGPRLHSMLEKTTKLVKVGAGVAPFFQSDCCSHGQGSTCSLFPACLRHLLLYGSVPKTLLPCLIAIAERDGITALLQERDCVEVLFEIASGSSRASGTTWWHNPWQEARSLLAKLAQAQGNELGIFLASHESWAERYRCDFFEAKRLHKVAFSGSMKLMHLPGKASHVEGLMLSSLMDRTVLKLDDLVVFQPSSCCCLVHDPRGDVQGNLLCNTKDIRQSGSFIQWARLRKKFLLSMLECQMPFLASHVVLSFLDERSESTLFPTHALPSHEYLLGDWMHSRGGTVTIAQDGEMMLIITNPYAECKHTAVSDFVRASECTYFGLKGRLDEGTIVWSNGAVWTKCLRQENTEAFPLYDFNVIQQVHHSEPAAVIDPEEAEAVVHTQEAGLVERNLGVGIVVDENIEQIFLCTFNRYPRELEQVLQHGPALQRCREALHEHGRTWKLPSGAAVFVHPQQYDDVMMRIPTHLSHRDVLVAASLECLLEQDLGSIMSGSGSFHGAWVKARRELEVHDGSGLPAAVSAEGDVMRSAEDTFARVEVRRSFICLVPSRRGVRSVTQSEVADESYNPRRIVSE